MIGITGRMESGVKETTKRADYWRQYFDETTAKQSDAKRQAMTITSDGVRLHLDVYEQSDRSAPTLLFNHGGGGYSRLFVPVALALYERGYTVVLPDQRGQGYSEGDRSDFTVGELARNVADAAAWARARYSGRLFLLGASVGSGLAYQAAALGAPVDALILHNLYEFGSERDALAVSRFAGLAKVPGVVTLSRWLTGLGAALLPRLKVPFGLLGRFEQMVDERDTRFYPIWKADPLPIKAVSLRYLQSTFTTPPPIPLEQNRLPALVINPTRDRMVAPAVTRRNYDRLGGAKTYAEIPVGHWATDAAFVQEYVGLLDDFMRRHAG